MRDKVYAEKNKDEILKRNKIKDKCDICNKEMNKYSIPRHKK